MDYYDKTVDKSYITLERKARIDLATFPILIVSHCSLKV